MKNADLFFKEIEVTQGGNKVVWEWIGEGKDGDYNEADQTDIPLLRFSCYTDRDESGEMYGEWRDLPDASYCTQMPITSLRRHLLIASGVILDAIEDSNYKRELERLSWFAPTDF